MASMFQDRERAAEGWFAHEEEVRFLAKRKAIQSLAIWAAAGMGLGADEGSTYAARKVDAFVAGTHDDQLAAAIQTELEDAGKPALSTQVGAIFAQAEADALFALRGQPKRAPERVETAREEWARKHPDSKPSWGWRSL